MVQHARHPVRGVPLCEHWVREDLGAQALVDAQEVRPRIVAAPVLVSLRTLRIGHGRRLRRRHVRSDVRALREISGQRACSPCGSALASQRAAGGDEGQGRPRAQNRVTVCQLTSEVGCAHSLGERLSGLPAEGVCWQVARASVRASLCSFVLRHTGAGDPDAGRSSSPRRGSHARSVQGKRCGILTARG